jgi:hypothetical protein
MELWKFGGNQRKDNWDKFVKALERDITKLKIDLITETEWKEYYENFGMSKVPRLKKEQRRRAEAKGQTTTET